MLDKLRPLWYYDDVRKREKEKPYKRKRREKEIKSMTNIYIVNVENRFEGNTTKHYFTTKAKAEAYAEAINTEFNKAKAEGRYGEMVEYVDAEYGIKEVEADEEF